MADTVTSTAQTGQVTVGTSSVQLTSTNNAVRVRVRALSANTGKVYIGNSSAVTTSTGYELAAGEAVDIQVGNTNALWAIASAASQGVCYIAY